MKALYATDPELGAMRLCRRCDEWYPADAEFWYMRRPKDQPGIDWLCKACQGEHRRRWGQAHGKAS